MLGTGVKYRDLFPRKLFELFSQLGLVCLDGEDVVSARADDRLGGVALAVQRIGGDDGSGDVDAA
jgi:hypothetical protein